MKRLFGILGSIFGSFGCHGSPHPPKAKPPQHSVIVQLKLSDDNHGREDERDEIHRWSDKLEQAILAAKAGEFDGDFFGDGECTLYMYGPDADALFAAIQPLLEASPLVKGGFAIKRYGEASDAGAKEVRVSY